MTIAFQAGAITLHHGHCIKVMRELPDASVDAVVTDPPYGLAATDLRYVADALQRWFAGDRDFVPETGGGFMGKRWDDFVPPPSAWDEAYRLLKPGGHLLAFAGSRTHDLMSMSIRLAGFEIRDSIAWLYGSGFPKSMDVSAAIDKLDAASERAARAREFQSWLREHLTSKRINELTGTDMGHHLTTHPTQPAVATAELFDMLRPELPAVPERIEQLVAERTIESANFAAREVTGKHRAGTARGAAGFTVAGEGKERRDLAFTEEARAWEGWGTALKPAFEPIVVARKPLAGTVAANVLAYRTGGMNIDATRTSWGAGGDKSAMRKAAGYSDAAKKALGGVVASESSTGFSGDVEGTDSSGGRWPTNVVLDESQAAELDRQSGVLKSGTMRAGTERAPRAGGVIYGADARNFTPADTYGDEGGASRFFPTFRYEAKAPTSERPEQGGVQHPTVKPLALMQWLVRLVTPPAGVVLEPFAGSGTTVEACLREGFGCVAIEREADYLPLILQRIEKPHEVSLFDGLFEDGDAA